MSGYFPALADLRPHLSDPALLASTAPPSPSSTSVSDGSGPEEFEFPKHSLLGPSRAAVVHWKGGGAEGDGGQRRAREAAEQTASGKAARPAGDLLPYEIWAQIFKYLTSRDLKPCMLVSHLCCQVVVELLWHKPSFYRVHTLHRLLYVIDPPPASFTPSTDPMPSLLRPPTTFVYAQLIRRLNLMNVAEGVDDNVLYHLRSCSRLERLTLQGCSLLTDDALSAVLGNGNMPDLVALDLTNVKLLSDVALTAIARGCPRLQGLNLTGCQRVTDDGVTAIAESCRLLRRIKLVRCAAVTDSSIIALARSCPLLLEVDLIDVALITAAGVRELWLFSANLRELRLSNCFNVTDEGFPYLFPPTTGKAAQSTFNMTRPMFPPASLRPSASEATTAVSSAYSSPEPSMSSVPDLLEGGPSATLVPPPNWMRAFEYLRILDLTSCVPLTDQAVDAIVTNAPRIRSLVLAKCVNLTDESLLSICRLGRSLHQLHMGHVASITDGAVSRLARVCTRLRYVDFACCPLLSDASVLELSQLSKLRRIGLVRVANLTDRAIYALVERSSSLERIHLSYCENISIEAIHFLLQRLRNLTHLSLTGVPAFHRDDLQRFCRQPPKDFNAHQRSAFCVYSGNGVRELRQYLASLFAAAEQKRSDAGASSPSSSSVSISFDHDQEEPPLPEHLDGGLLASRPAERAALPFLETARPTVASPTMARPRPPPLGFGLFGVRNTSGGSGGSLGRSPSRERTDDARASHLRSTPDSVNQTTAAANAGPSATSSSAEPSSPATGNEDASPSFSSRLIRLGRGYTS